MIASAPHVKILEYLGKEAHRNLVEHKYRVWVKLDAPRTLLKSNPWDLEFRELLGIKGAVSRSLGYLEIDPDELGATFIASWYETQPKAAY